MKLIRKISASTSNIIIDNHYLYYNNHKRLFTIYNLVNESIIFTGTEKIKKFGLTDDYYYYFWVTKAEDDFYEFYLHTTVSKKNSINKIFNFEFRPLIHFKKNLIFVDFSTVKKPDNYGLFDIDNKSYIWQNNREIPYDIFIKGDNYFTLTGPDFMSKKEMRLEMIEAMTGKVKWSIPTKVEIIYSENPQNIIDVIDGYLVMTYDYKKIVGIDLRNGKIGWEWSLEKDIEKFPDFYFCDNEFTFSEYKGKYYFGYNYKLMSLDIVNRKITVESEEEIEIKGKTKKTNYADLFLFDDKFVFYGVKYSKKLGAHYSVIGVYDLIKRKVVDFADDEFPGPLRFKPAIYGNRLFQQDNDGNIHIFELEM